MECYDCGANYERIAAHWSMSSSCSHPEFTEKQWKILTGILMGDGSVDDKFDDRRNPRLRIIMTNKKYLEYIADVLGPLCTGGPVTHRTPEEIANRDQDGRFSRDDSQPEDFNELYQIQTISHPKIEEFASWYSTGKKVWPEDITMTPTVLKHLFVCDGSFNNNGHRMYVQISCSNERENKDKVESYFTDVGLAPSRWQEGKRKDSGYTTDIIFNKKESKEFFDYIGDPVPGFGYKWPN